MRVFVSRALFARNAISSSTCQLLFWISVIVNWYSYEDHYALVEHNLRFKRQRQSLWDYSGIRRSGSMPEDALHWSKFQIGFYLVPGNNSFQASPCVATVRSRLLCLLPVASDACNRVRSKASPSSTGRSPPILTYPWLPRVDFETDNTVREIYFREHLPRYTFHFSRVPFASLFSSQPRRQTNRSTKD